MKLFKNILRVSLMVYVFACAGGALIYLIFYLAFNGDQVFGEWAYPAIGLTFISPFIVNYLIGRRMLLKHREVSIPKALIILELVILFLSIVVMVPLSTSFLIEGYDVDLALVLLLIVQLMGVLIWDNVIALKST